MIVFGLFGKKKKGHGVEKKEAKPITKVHAWHGCIGIDERVL